jgi:hypothetical protein
MIDRDGQAGQLTRTVPPGSRALLARLLEQPHLVAAVQSLPARALGKLINHIGLEDAGEIVALATTDQIRRIFDDDLWRSELPGQDEGFDADRFALWLEVMIEAGEEFAAQRLAELPEDLLTLALARQVLVINIEEMAVAMSGRQSDDDAQLEKALESCLCEEIGEYRIIARRHEGFDAVIGILLALDRDHHEYLARLLERCCHAAAEYIEDNGGLFHVLTAGEMLEVDAAAEREDRRAEEGYLSPSSAASFLALARTTPLDDLVGSHERDPITRAYFRSLRRPADAQAAADAATAAPGRGAAGLVELLREAGVLPRARAVALLEGAGSGTASGNPEPLAAAMRRLGERAPAEHDRRMEELAFVTNVLLAGASLEGRAFRPTEAARAGMAVCNLGLEYLAESKASTVDQALAGGADKLFRVGWRVLAQDVALPAARRLAALLGESDSRQRMADSAREQAVAALRSGIAAGRPWTARRKLSELADHGRLAALLALLDECPHLAGDAAGLVAASGSELAFISCTRQLRAVAGFLAGPYRP